jgi:hypothetical protein
LGATISHSTLLGRTNYDAEIAVAVDASSNIYASGGTDDADFPLVNPLQAVYAGGTDAFVTKIGPAFAASIQPPIDADGSSGFNAKRGVVPVKFVLEVEGTLTCDLPAAVVAVYRIDLSTPTLLNESEYIMAADYGSNFRISDCEYVYNLSTKSLGAGTYRVNILIGGQVVGTATFGLK